MGSSLWSPSTSKTGNESATVTTASDRLSPGKVSSSNTTLTRCEPGESNRRIVSPRAVAPDRTSLGRGDASEPSESDEILVVVSKLKKYVADSAEMNTSSQGMAVLSAHLRKVCDRAVQIARSDGRKTVLERDFEKAVHAFEAAMGSG